MILLIGRFRGDDMRRLAKGIIIVGLILIVLILIISRNNRYLKGPNPEDLSSIILIDVIDEEGVQKITINDQIDINNFLDILANAKMIDEQSSGHLPNKTNYTMVLYDFKSSGKSWRTMYDENGDFYIS